MDSLSGSILTVRWEYFKVITLKSRYPLSSMYQFSYKLLKVARNSSIKRPIHPLYKLFALKFPNAM